MLAEVEKDELLPEPPQTHSYQLHTVQEPSHSRFVLGITSARCRRKLTVTPLVKAGLRLEFLPCR